MSYFSKNLQYNKASIVWDYCRKVHGIERTRDIEEAAVIKIQTFLRMKRERRKWLRLHAATITIQKIFRMFLEQKKVTNMIGNNLTKENIAFFDC